MNSARQVGHLARRFFGSLSRRAPLANDVAWALGHLMPAEATAWKQMPAQDRRHSIVVARRFAVGVPTATRAELAGALLHDVGKTVSGLGTFGRVAATTLGPRTNRFRLYHDHEQLGIEMLREAGSDPDTLAIIAGTAQNSLALRDADAI